MERKAVSRDNPWIEALWLLALLGLGVAGIALYLGYRTTSSNTAADPALGPILITAGAALLAASLVALALGIAVCAHLWERRNNP